MKRIIFILFGLLLVSLPLFAGDYDTPGYEDKESPKWKEYKSDHFIVHYKNASEDFIQQVASSSEQYYNNISDDLGFRRFNFWLWDNRANIYIYDNAADYQAVSGMPSWSAGASLPQSKAIYSYPNAQGFLDTVLPHEMGHIIFREFVGINNYAIPLWLEEGVASYQMKTKYSGASQSLQEAIKSGTFMPLDQLSAVDIRTSSDEKKVRLFYNEAYSAVDYMIQRFGRDKFVTFCQNLRDNKDLNRAIASVYSFEGLKDLSAAWKQAILNE
ncbi:MAG: peptidase MA family metallohydrolase [Candidatus Omnitrophota bacterium]